MATEQVMYGVRKGNEDWQEEILSTNPAIFPKVRRMATKDGFTRIRIAKIDLSTPPDFKKIINKLSPSTLKTVSKILNKRNPK